MAKKVILDVDPHIDGAVALALALFDPDLEVVAVTATAGCVSAAQATKNIQAIIEQLDPPRIPRIGVATETDAGYLGDLHHLYGKDGLGGANLAVSELHHRHTADKVICEEIRKSPGEVSVVSLGPLTNMALALTREPDLESQIREIYIRGGSLGSGDVTSAAEFNIYCNPTAARRIFHSAGTKSIIPLDITQQVVMTYDQLDEISDVTTKSGTLLRKFLPFIFRSYRTVWGLEGIHLPSAVALAVISHPELFASKSLYGDVETSGDLTLGTTLFDRRIRPDNQPNVQVITEIDVVATMDYILRGLATAS